MTKLREFECRPVVSRQLGDQAGHDAGFTDIPGMPADDNNRHYSLLPNRARLARLRRYSRNGLAGVPQKAVSNTEDPCNLFTRKTFFGNTPACPPSSTPSWMRACSPTPTCPPITTLFSIVMLPENPACAAIITPSPNWQLWPICTRLSIFVPRPIRVVSSAPRSMVVFAPISTSSPISSFPICGNFSCRPLLGSRTYPNPSLPSTAPACTITRFPTREPGYIVTLG